MDTYNDVPLVSVRLMTYNHENFIRDAMDGIMDQKVNFLVEVVVGDDFSTDDTLKIIRQYKSSEYIKIKILNRVKGDEYWKKRQSKGRLYNFINILENCKGKYIALLDGDDYWTDPLKLQKQVDVLEKFNKISIVSHACKRISSKHTEEVLTYNGKSYLDLSDYLISQPFCATASLVFKKEVVDGYKGWMYHLFAGDFVLRYLAFLKGDMYYINDVMSVYNKGVEGSWSKRKMTTQKALREYKDNCRMLSYMRGQSTKLTENAVKTKKKQLRMNVIMKIAISKNLLAGLFYLVKKKEITSRNILRYVKLKVL